jgi:glycosyltransferase involved in cell wall biosynthesis
MTETPRVLLFGSVPMPHGGIQQHTIRLLDYLQHQGYEARLADVLHWRAGQAVVQAPGIAPCGNWVFAIAKQIHDFQPHLIHSHVYRWRITSALGLLSHVTAQDPRPIRTMLTIHGESFFTILPAPVRPMVYAALRRVDHVIADNDKLLNFLHERVGVSPDRCSIQGAFLPPRADELDPATLPADLRAFMADHSPLLAGNGAVATFAGEDKYGIDLIVRATARLRETFPRIGVVFCVTALSEPDRMEKLRALATELGVQDCIRFVANLPSLLPVVAAADATIRATNTDGDALSVHESLMLGTPALASDVVTRPALCDKFRNRDADDLAEVALRVLQRGRHGPEVTQHIHHAGPELLGIYDRLLGRGPGSAAQGQSTRG